MESIRSGYFVGARRIPINNTLFCQQQWVLVLNLLSAYSSVFSIQSIRPHESDPTRLFKILRSIFWCYVRQQYAGVSVRAFDDYSR
jgi:hypothetical protein